MSPVVSIRRILAQLGAKSQTAAAPRWGQIIFAHSADDRHPMRSLLGRNMMRDLLWVLLFFLIVQFIENILLLIWAHAVSGQKVGQGGEQTTYTLAGVYSIGMLCSSAASFAGGLIGFLFGIPQSNPVVRRFEAAEDRVQGTESPATGEGAGQGRELARSASVEHAVTGSETDVAGAQGTPGSGLHRNTNLESISDALTKGILAIGAFQLHRVGDLVRSIAPVLGESLGPGSGGQIVGLSVLVYGAVGGFLFGYLATRIYLTGVFERSDPTP